MKLSLYVTLIFHKSRTETRKLIFIAQPDFGPKDTTIGKLGTKTQEAAVFPETPWKTGIREAKNRLSGGFNLRNFG